LKNDDLQFKKNISPEAKDLLKKILKTDPTKRITLEKIFQHPFIKKHIDEYENNEEVFKYIPSEPEYEFDPEGYDIDMKDSLSPSRIGDSGQTLKQIQEEEFLNDPEAQQKFVQKKLKESKINPADVKRVFFKRDEEGNLKMKIEMNGTPKIRYTDRSSRKPDEINAAKIEKVVTETLNQGKPRIQHIDNLFDRESPTERLIAPNISPNTSPTEQIGFPRLEERANNRIDRAIESDNIPKAQPKTFQFNKVDASPIHRPVEVPQTISSFEVGIQATNQTQPENNLQSNSAQQTELNSARIDHQTNSDPSLACQ
jgi:serine/threonine protein kinase